MKRVARLALLLAVAATTGCGAPSPEEARARAIAYFGREVHSVDHGWSSIFDLLERRFDLTVRLADGSFAHGSSQVARPEDFVVYRRLLDPHARATRRQIADLPTAIDRVTATALHCDRLGLPEDWIGILRKATGMGAYALTHAVLATRWTLENGCLPPIALVALENEQIEALSGLIDDRHRLTERHDLATDIWLEAIAMLYYAGAGDRVREEWIDAVVATQRPDGGFPNHPNDARSHPHPTALALWILCEHLQPDARPVGWIPRS